MGFFTNWFNGGSIHDLSPKIDKDYYEIKMMKLNELKMMKLRTKMYGKEIENNIQKRKDRLAKLRNPKSIYLRKKKAT